MRRIHQRQSTRSRISQPVKFRYPSTSRFRFTSRCVLFGALLSAHVSLNAARWHEENSFRWSELPQNNERTAAGFQIMEPQQTGVLFSNSLSEVAGSTNRTLYNGSGVAAGDFDGDGLADLAFAGLEARLELFKNLGGWSFTNVTSLSGISVTNLICRGVVLSDVNGDGLLDLLISVSGGGVKCWRNERGGRFSEITPTAGTRSPHGSTTLALADVDGNGTIDLYISNNRSEDIRDRGQVQIHLVKGVPTVPPALANRLVILNERLEEFGEPDRLLLNDGSANFREVDWTEGTFLDESGQSLRRPPLDWGLTATFRDLNGDQQPDLYVCNDYWTPDRIWINDGTGRFRAAATFAFRKISGSSMGVDMADLNFDGLPEIFVVDMLSRSPAWRKRQMDAQKPSPNLPGVIADRPQILRNTLFLARKDGTYAEIAEMAGISASEWAWQPLFLDVDLDGHLDLIITTGHARDVQDRDAEALIQSRQRNYNAIRDPAERRRVFAADLLAHMQLYPKLETPILTFRNRGDLHFDDVTDQWGTSQNGIHHGIATADFDGDGDLDLAVNNLNAAASLYQNMARRPRVAVRLRGRAPNTQAIGTLVTLQGGAVPLQRMEMVAGGRYLSGCDPLLVFAAGTNATPMTLEVGWRSGKRQVIPGIAADRLYEITEHPSNEASSDHSSKTNAHPAWFEDRTAQLNHVHHETLFDDFQHQPLLPWRLSQLGPALAWGDLDRDGWEDLIIGTGAGGKIGVYKNNGHGHFLKWTNAPFGHVLPRDTAGILAFLSSTNRTVLITALANYEDGQTNAACLISFEPGFAGPIATLKDVPTSTGPLAMADFDADGDLDLFVGGRVKAGRWPEAGDSFVLRRNGQVWQRDIINSRLFASLGPASSAVWTDLDLDGFPELVVTCEWGPISIFRNKGGNLTEWHWRIQATSPNAQTMELRSFSGLWSSVAAGDFDGDGQLDLLVGNWGENSEYRASQDSALRMYAGYWGNEGSLSLVETTIDPSRGALTPVRPLSDLITGMPFLAGMFASHRAFSEKNLDEVLGTNRAAAREYSVTTLATTLFLNRGDSFELRVLPRDAQLAPTFGLAVADFDGDGHEDAFLAQNFFATRTGMPRLDAGRGLLLRGDGKGGLSVVQGQEAGIQVYGEQRAAAVADFDHDGRTDLAVSQNGASTRLFRNTIGRPGIRVKLAGRTGNPTGIGCVLRLTDGNKTGATRELHAGAGYWSQDSSVTVLHQPIALRMDVTQLEVRWPGGEITTVPVPPGATQLVVRSRR